MKKINKGNISSTLVHKTLIKTLLNIPMFNTMHGSTMKLNAYNGKH